MADFGHKADLSAAPAEVRLRGRIGHRAKTSTLPHSTGTTELDPELTLLHPSILKLLRTAA
jgi:hypothetical protein